MWFRITNFGLASFPRSGDIFDTRPIFGSIFLGYSLSIKYTYPYWNKYNFWNTMNKSVIFCIINFLYIKMKFKKCWCHLSTDWAHRVRYKVHDPSFSHYLSNLKNKKQSSTCNVMFPRFVQPFTLVCTCNGASLAMHYHRSPNLKLRVQEYL
jgi:hypothetical protein